MRSQRRSRTSPAPWRLVEVADNRLHDECEAEGVIADLSAASHRSVTPSTSVPPSSCCAARASMRSAERLGRNDDSRLGDSFTKDDREFAAGTSRREPQTLAIRPSNSDTPFTDFGEGQPVGESQRDHAKRGAMLDHIHVVGKSWTATDNACDGRLRYARQERGGAMRGCRATRCIGTGG